MADGSPPGASEPTKPPCGWSPVWVWTGSPGAEACSAAEPVPRGTNAPTTVTIHSVNTTRAGHRAPRKQAAATAIVTSPNVRGTDPPPFRWSFQFTSPRRVEGLQVCHDRRDLGISEFDFAHHDHADESGPHPVL